MESATLTRPRPVAASSAPAQTRGRSSLWPWVGLVLLVIGACVGFLMYPTYPNYDSYYSMLWGRELLDGTLPVFETYRAPTPHPLATVVGAVIAPFGHGAERLWIALCVLSFVALVIGVYRMGREAFTPFVGFVAAALLVSRFDFAFYAARGYIDIGYMALVVWAAVLEGRAPRTRPVAVLVLLGIAGLLRPEAWLIAGLYWLWVAWPERRRLGRVALYAVLAAIGPVVWALTDFLVTGDPLYSLTYTSAFAEELGRAKGAQGVPAAIWEYLVKLDKLPVLLGGMAGLLAALMLVPRRMATPALLLLVGVGTFALVGVAGFSVIDRYLLVTSLMIMVFCAFALAGWTMLVHGTRARRWWSIGAGAVVALGIVWTAIHVDLDRLDNELALRGDAHHALHDILKDPAVQRGLECGPINVPNHKLIPDIRWIEDLPDRAVLARSEGLYRGPDRGRRRSAARVRRSIAAGGVSIIPHQRGTLLRHALVEETDDPATVLPLPGYERRAVSTYYAAYVRCP